MEVMSCKAWSGLTYSCDYVLHQLCRAIDPCPEVTNKVYQVLLQPHALLRRERYDRELLCYAQRKHEAQGYKRRQTRDRQVPSSKTTSCMPEITTVSLYLSQLYSAFDADEMVSGALLRLVPKLITPTIRLRGLPLHFETGENMGMQQA